MIDFHTHILPGMDDGSRDLSETEALLKEAVRQGTDRIAATPHFYAERESVGRFLKRREESLAKVRELSEKVSWMPEIRAGAEVYYFPGMGKAEMLPQLCLEGGNLLLVELPFAQWTGQMYRDLEEILTKQKLTVLLAHVERYYSFQKEKEVWEAVFELPLTAQINTGSLQRRKNRRFDLHFLKEGHPAVLGSDCHNPSSRPPNMEEGRRILEKHLGPSILEAVDEQGERLWKHGE